MELEVAGVELALVKDFFRDIHEILLDEVAVVEPLGLLHDKDAGLLRRSSGCPPAP